MTPSCEVQRQSPLKMTHSAIGNNSGREILQFTWQYDDELGEHVLVDFQVLFDAGPNNELNDADFAVICEELA
jgi:hypothetical protein